MPLYMTTQDLIEETVSAGGTINNLTINPETTLLRITANTTITGIAGGRPGRTLIIWAYWTALSTTLKNEDPGSLPENRITTYTGAGDHTINRLNGCHLFYDGSSQRWVITSPVNRISNLSLAGSVIADSGFFTFNSRLALIHNTIMFEYGTNAPATGQINMVGYQGGTLHARDLQIGDGRGVSLLSIAAGQYAVVAQKVWATAGETSVTLSSTVDDWAPSNVNVSTILAVQPLSSGLAINGISAGGPINGRRLTLINRSDTYSFSLTAEALTSSANNRFYAGATVNPHAGVELVWSSSVSRWVPIGV